MLAYTMRGRGFFWILVGMTLAGCGGGATDELPRVAVSGSVTLDGKPLTSGTIAFSPVPNQPNPVEVGAGISNGAYSISKADGPTPGSYRITIYGGSSVGGTAGDAPGMPPKATKDPVPEKYNARSTLTADVKAGGSSDMDFKLESK